MQAGKLRHRVTLLIPNWGDEDDAGDAPLSYSDGPTVYAGIEPLAGRELFWAQQIRPDVDTKVTLRYRGEVTSGYRMRWRNKIYEFGPPLSTEERKIDLVISAAEVQSNAQNN